MSNSGSSGSITDVNGFVSVLSGTLQIPGYHFKSAPTPSLAHGENVDIVCGYRISNRQPVIAKVSPASLRLEREFYIMKRLYQCTDGHLYVVRPLEYINLPSGVTVVIYSDEGYQDQYQRRGSDEPNIKPPSSDPGTNITSTTSSSGSYHGRDSPSCGPYARYDHAQPQSPLTIIHPRISAPVFHLGTFLRFAIQCTDCLDFIHRHNVVHHEIRLSAFQWNGEDAGRVRLCNFGSGSKSLEQYLTSEGWRKTANNAETMRMLAGLLVFMSPEQTGRTTYSPDHRSDIYSLGIVFFVLLTGRFPFVGSPLEILNGVLSRKIPMVHELQPAVPEVLSRIIEKMTHKAPDDRYSSAHGVRADLKRCLPQLTAIDDTSAEMIAPFPLGKDDIVSVFTLPKTLYDRNHIMSEMAYIIEDCASSQQTLRHRSRGKSISVTQTTVNAVSGDDDNISVHSGQESVGKEAKSVTSPSYCSNVDGNEVSSANSCGVPKNNSQNVTFIAAYGPGGIGKSSLFKAVHPIARQNGYIASAKFDMRHKVPYGCILRSLSQILQQFLSEPEEELVSFRNYMKAHLGAKFCNIELLADSVPELKALLGSFIPAASDATENTHLDNVQAQVRFHTLFIEVIRTITRWRMVTVFLDDLHLADEPSLELLEALVTSRTKLLICVSYRDQEVSEKFLKILENEEATTHFFQIQPLSVDSLIDFVCDTLHRSRETGRESVLPLVEIIYQKTRGNAFYAAQLLRTLEKKKLIYFNWERNEWDFNYAEIQQATLFAANVQDNAALDVSFLVERLRELPKEGQILLKWASYVGDTFSWSTVKNLMLSSDGSDTGSDYSDTLSDAGHGEEGESDDATTVETLYSGLRTTPTIQSETSGSNSSSLTRPHMKSRKSSMPIPRMSSSRRGPMSGLQAVLQEGYILPLESDEFKWSHDRLSQAAMELVDPKIRDRMHLRIARFLMKEPNFDVFLVADHLLKCPSLINAMEDKTPYYSIFMEAGGKARSSGAHGMAFAYYRAAINMDESEAIWENNYDTALTLYTSAVSLSWIVGEYEITEAYLDVIFTHVTDPIQRLAAFRIQSRYFASRQLHAESRESLEACLIELGMNPEEFEITKERQDKEFITTRARLQEIGAEQVLNVPACQDPRQKAIMDVLEELFTVAYWLGNHYHMNYWSSYAVNLSLTHGMTPVSGVAFAFMGIAAVVSFKEYKYAEEMGAIAVALSDLHGGTYEKGRVGLLYPLFLMKWKYHIRETHSWFKSGHRLQLAAGDRIYASFSQLHIALTGLYCGHHLSDVLPFAEACYRDTHTWSSTSDTNCLSIGLVRTIKALQGNTYIDTVNVYDGDDGFSDAHFVVETCAYSSKPDVPMNFYSSLKVFVLTLYGHYEEAIRVSDLYGHTNHLHPSHRHTRFMLIMHSVSIIEYIREHPNLPADRVRQLLHKVEENQTLVYEWVMSSRVNYIALWTFVEAERASLGPNIDFAKAARLFEEAINLAREGDWRFELSYMHEFAGRFYLNNGISNVAYSLIKKAIALYMKLGAYGLARTTSAKFQSLLNTFDDDRKEKVDAGIQTDPFPFLGQTGSWSTSSASHLPTTINEPYTSESIIPATTEQTLLTLDILDMASILKSSQVISSEIKFDGLLKSMMNIILENSGADCGAIIVTEEKYNVCAYGSQQEGSVTFNPPPELSEDDDRISSRIINHTIHTMESIYVHDVEQDARFAVGPWFERAGKKSVICMPIKHKGTLGGCLFLEGPVGVFSQRHITVLSLLCQQMGISISNAFLFKSVQSVMRSNMRMLEVQQQALEDARKSKEAAVKATRLREIFLANMSHEIRTPFSGFYGMISLLAETQLDAEQRDLVMTAKESCEVLLKIIDDLLNFSKLQAGKVALDLSPVIVEEMVADVVDVLIAMAIQKRLNVTYTVAPDVPSVVMADANRLRQIIINLLGNAIKFTHQGEINIRCSIDKKAKIEDEDKVSLLFEVIDTGIGISEDQRKVLFAPFSQVDGSTTRKYGGTGLGLSICLQLVQLMSGTIDVTSDTNKGSTFYFTVTLSRAPNEMAQRDAAMATFNRELANTRVLFVGKHTSTTTMISHLLPSVHLDSVYTVEELSAYKGTVHTVVIVGLLLGSDPECEAWTGHLQPFLDRASCVILMHYPSSSVCDVITRPLVASPPAIRMAVPLRRHKLLRTLMDTLHHVPPESPQPLRNSSDITAQERDWYSTLTVLAAEDNPVSQKLLQKQLTRLGFKVICANNGLEAVEAWTTRPPGFFTMAFFDHHMPKCDGVEATKRIRKLERQQRSPDRFPIIALTADVQESARNICMKAGMDGYLTKPLNQQVLVETLRRYCPLP